MRINQYTRKHNFRPIWTGIAGLAITGILINTWSPDRWWKEAILLCLLTVSGYQLSVNIIGNKKYSLLLLLEVFGLLILRRFGVLDILTGILLSVIILLLSLIN